MADGWETVELDGSAIASCKTHGEEGKEDFKIVHLDLYVTKDGNQLYSPVDQFDEETLYTTVFERIYSGKDICGVEIDVEEYGKEDTRFIFMVTPDTSATFIQTNEDGLILKFHGINQYPGLPVSLVEEIKEEDRKYGNS